MSTRSSSTRGFRVVLVVGLYVCLFFWARSSCCYAFVAPLPTLTTRLYTTTTTPISTSGTIRKESMLELGSRCCLHVMMSNHHERTRSCCSKHRHHNDQRRRTTTTALFLGPAAAAAAATTNAISTTALLWRTLAMVTTALVLAATAFVKLILDRPSRTYQDTRAIAGVTGTNTVAQEYDAWADDGILEYYWGEHIHLGYYAPGERGTLVTPPSKNFIQAKYDFIDEMMKFAGISVAPQPPQPSSLSNEAPSTLSVLDVGCGFGGTSRYLAKTLGPTAHVTGITLSPNQVKRGTELAVAQSVANRTKFVVMDALDMEFDDNSFDIVWACESGEHMPDKKRYISEMMRVLKPGGTFVMACWSQRDDASPDQRPFDARDLRDLQYLYEEWTHPYFISIRQFREYIEETGVMNTPVITANWVDPTLPSWRHSIWVGILDPRGWIFKPRLYFKCIRDAYCLERMHRAFKRGLMEYGMWTATKKQQQQQQSSSTSNDDAVGTTLAA